MTAQHRVVIAGAGVGGLETALALHAAAGDRVAITLLDASDHFVYRPWVVTEPFTGARTVAVDLRGLAADKGFELVVDRMAAVEADRVTLSGGNTLPFDSLVLALGTRTRPIVEGAFTFHGRDDARALGEQLERVPAGGRIAFVISASAVWALPAYELALQTAARSAREGRDQHVMLVTAEPEPLAAFGPVISAHTRDLLEERGIELYTHTAPTAFDASGLFVPMAGTIPADLAVALPALVGPRLAGVPRDAAGFVPVDDFCRVEGMADVFAVGDMTARDLKQGGLAAQQGDVAAAVIARAAGATVLVEPYRPVLRATLLTAEGSRYLRHPAATEEEPDATHAPWWPPHKIAATHLGPYLATHADLLRPVPEHA
jgi:sulfide:quinone oxidoreductase